MNRPFYHNPVLLSEVVSLFTQHLSGAGPFFLVDATVGGAGHAAALLRALPTLHLLGVDRDKSAVSASRIALEGFGDRARIEEGTWIDIPRLIKKVNFPSRISGVLVDCGVSSHQLDTPGRGFSFQRDGPLDMRMEGETSSCVSAGELVQKLPEAALERIISAFGEDPFAGIIARAIVARRDVPHSPPLNSTLELARVVSSAVGQIKGRNGGHRVSAAHPATRTFQALRIAVNSELVQLDTLLNDICTRILQPGGILGVITFHSLEDRLVKKRFNKQDFALAGGAICAGNKEIECNPRARSARLRGGKYEAWQNR